MNGNFMTENKVFTVFKRSPLPINLVIPQAQKMLGQQPDVKNFNI